MTWYQLREWYRYRRSAIGRHGMHSPFVYRMVDEALKPALKRIPKLRYRNAAGRELELPELDRGLLRRIVHYTQVQEIQLCDADGAFPEHCRYLRDHGVVENPDPSLMRFRRLFLLHDAEGTLALVHWPEAAETLAETLHSEDIVAVPGICESPAHATGWRTMCERLPHRMCIDFFQLGLLAFREEFQVPQGFRVRFPL